MSKTNIPIDEPLPDHIRLYKNGALFDKDKGRIVALRPELAEKNTQITSENSSLLLARKVERKREILERVANQAVQRKDLAGLYGDDAWLAEIGYNMQIKATTIDDPKMVDAARFMLKETGRAEELGARNDSESAGSELMAQLARIAGAIADAIPVQIHETIEGKIEDV